MARARRPISDVGEFGLLAALLPTLANGPGVLVGPGDDCAVLARPNGAVLFTVDALVEDVHFRRGWFTPRQLGRKAFLVNASDIAAMGGAPRWCVLQLAASPQTPAADVMAISRGVAAAAAEVGARLVGGNLSRARELSATVALVGDAPPTPVLRRGARAGDQLYVTGSLGGAALGVRQLSRSPATRSAAVRRFRAPIPRLAIGAGLARGIATAMVDVSDGLLQDLGHLCAASGVGARVLLERVPCAPQVRRVDYRLALTGGEDYELLCAVPASRCRRVERLAARCGCPITWIGECVPGRDVEVVDGNGRVVPVTGGHDHFARGRR